MIDCEIDVECEGAVHAVVVRDGIPQPPAAHGDADLALAALGGEVPPCLYAVRAVLEAPMQLMLYEVALVRDQPTGLFAGNRVSSQVGEQHVDPRRVHPVVRRLAALQEIREHRGASTRRDAADGWARAVAGGVLGTARSLGVAVGPAVGLEKGPSSRPTLQLSPTWAETVFLSGLTTATGTIVAAMELDGDDVVLTYLDKVRARWALLERTQPACEALPGIRFGRAG